MEGNAKEENQPSKKDDLPADIFSSVLEVLEVLGIANYSMLVRVSSVFTFKNTVLGRARTVLGGARNWAFSFFFGVFRAKKTASLHGIPFHGCKTVVMVTANRPVFAG